MIGQICSPVEGPAWHVLFAVQEWNLRMNVLYKVSAFAIDIVKGVRIWIMFLMLTFLAVPECDADSLTFLVKISKETTSALLSDLYV